MPTGGGGGGGAVSGSDGQTSGVTGPSPILGGAAGTAVDVPQPGNSSPVLLVGTGGGGGYSPFGTYGQGGGAGGKYGGGGGGGGGALNGYPSGAGGKGGSGYVLIIAY